MLFRVIAFPAAVAEHEGELVEIIKNAGLALWRVVVLALNPDQAGFVIFVNLERDRDQLAFANSHQRQFINGDTVMGGELKPLDFHWVKIGELRGVQCLQGGVKLGSRDFGHTVDPAPECTGVSLVEIKEVVEVGIGYTVCPDLPGL